MYREHFLVSIIGIYLNVILTKYEMMENIEMNESKCIQSQSIICQSYFKTIAWSNTKMLGKRQVPHVPRHTKLTIYV